MNIISCFSCVRSTFAPFVSSLPLMQVQVSNGEGADAHSERDDGDDQ
jgi:hypothetical protein